MANSPRCASGSDDRARQRQRARRCDGVARLALARLPCRAREVVHELGVEIALRRRVRHAQHRGRMKGCDKGGAARVHESGRLARDAHRHPASQQRVEGRRPECDDHRRAQTLAEGLRAIPALTVDGPHTNMLFVTLPKERLEEFATHLQARGIRASLRGPVLRLVTHLDIDDAGLERALGAFREFYR